MSAVITKLHASDNLCEEQIWPMSPPPEVPARCLLNSGGQGLEGKDRQLCWDPEKAREKWEGSSGRVAGLYSPEWPNMVATHSPEEKSKMERFLSEQLVAM